MKRLLGARGKDRGSAGALDKEPSDDGGVPRGVVFDLAQPWPTHGDDVSAPDA